MAKPTISLDTLQAAHEMTKKVSRYMRRCRMRLVVKGNTYQVVRDLSPEAIRNGKKSIIISTKSPYKLMKSYLLEWESGMSWQPDTNGFPEISLDEFIAFVMVPERQARRI